jgi:aromatic ring hydroxylase
VTTHPMFRPLVDVRARIYDMQHGPQFADALCYCGEAGEIVRSPSSCHAHRRTGAPNALRSRQC